MFARLLHREPGRHWKLMTAAIIAFTGAGLVAAVEGSILWAASLWLFIVILVVQWLCITPPGIDEQDIP